jgi:DNA-binding LacI/PurR family transcriptional regulator
MLGYISAIHLKGNVTPAIDSVEVTDSDAVRSMLARHDPDAIVCVNDETAAGLMTTLYAIGRSVPDEIQVTGIDNVKYAAMLQVPLTTIDQPCAEIGATALMAMLDRLAHPGATARDFSVDFTLVVRQSTRSMPAMTETRKSG